MPISYARAVSLFSNCGAGDIGYRQAGFRFEVMAELDPRRLEVCLLNHPTASGVAGDLRETWPRVIEVYRQRAGNVTPALMAACPPCQRWSPARGKRGHKADGAAGSKEKLLVTIIADVAKILRPRILVVENVPAFLTGKVRHPETKQPVSAARLLVDRLASEYIVFPILVDLCDFGVPQVRTRAFLTFVRVDLPSLNELVRREKTPYPRPTHATDYDAKPITITEALKEFGLPRLDATSIEAATSKENDLHCVPVWDDRRYRMVAAIPRNSGCGAWTNDTCASCGFVAAPASAICEKCGEILLRPVFKARNGRYRLIRGFKSSSYTRMKPDQPAATITTASGHLGSHRTIHPSENRVLSPLECARLQTFPADFDWGNALAKWGHTNIRVMIGEAVPPLFTKQHGEVLQSILRRKTGNNLIAFTDRRCRSARKKLGLADSK